MAQLYGGIQDRISQVRSQTRCGCEFQYLLMSPLERTIAVPQMAYLPAIADQLHFDCERYLNRDSYWR